MAGDGYPHIFAGNLGEKLAVHRIAIEADFLIFDGGRTAADVGVRSKLASAGSYRLSQRRGYFGAKRLTKRL